MNIEEGVEKVAQISEQVCVNTSARVQRPSISGAFIAGGMVLGGAAVFYRGAYYLVGYILNEKKTTLG